MRGRRFGLFAHGTEVRKCALTEVTEAGPGPQACENARGGGEKNKVLQVIGNRKIAADINRSSNLEHAIGPEFDPWQLQHLYGVVAQW